MLHGVSKERKFLCLSPRSVVFRGNFRGGKCWNEAISSRGWKDSISLPGLMKLTSIASFTSLFTPLFTSKNLERSRFSVFEKWQDEKFLSNYRSRRQTQKAISALDLKTAFGPRFRSSLSASPRD